MRDKIKEKMGKRGNEELLSEDTFEKIKDYQIYTNELIGEGSYGRVYRARA